VDHGSSPLDVLRARLASQRDSAWVQAVVSRSAGEGAQLLRALVRVGASPQPGSERRWSYEAYDFISLVVPARRVAPLCVTGPQEIALGPLRATLELRAANVSWRRRPSHALYKDLSLPYPATIYEAPLADQIGAADSTYLVGAEETPSFATLGSAFNAFCFDDFAVTGTSYTLLGELLVCFVHTKARICGVRIRPASLEVRVGGRSLAGAYLELAGAEHRATVRLNRPGRVSLPLPAGLPSDAWLWLKAGSEWLDYRPLVPWGGQLSPDIEVELPRDPVAEVSRLAAQGEGQHLEYKSKLPDNHDEKHTVFKTVAAFASGEGGTMLFGIDREGAVCGLVGNPAKERDRLTDLLRDLVSPSPQVKIDVVRIEGRVVIVLRVEPGDGTLHSLTLERNKPEFFVRRDATTFYARPEELESTVRRGG
jgi:hypothetical protein